MAALFVGLSDASGKAIRAGSPRARTHLRHGGRERGTRVRGRSKTRTARGAAPQKWGAAPFSCIPNLGEGAVGMCSGLLAVRPPARSEAGAGEVPTGCPTPGTARGGRGGQRERGREGGKEGGSSVAAAGATSEQPPRSSRERVALPSKEMRSLPCAAHLGLPRCYFYLTFQARFLFPAVLL